MEEVLARLRGADPPRQRPAAPLLRCGAVTLDPRAARVTLDGAPVRLTSHEFRVLSYLMHHRGRVVLAERADRAHLRAGCRPRLEHGGSVRRPAAPQARAGVIETVRGLGYRIGDAAVIRLRIAQGRSSSSVGAVDARPAGRLAPVLRAGLAALPTSSCRCSTGWCSASLALVFMLGGLSQVRRGITPINSLAARLAAVRVGRAPRIDGDYPAEVQPLVRRPERAARASRGGGAARTGDGRRSGARPEDAAGGAGAGCRRGRARGSRRAVASSCATRSSAHASGGRLPPRPRPRRGLRRRTRRRCDVSASIEPLARTLRRLHAERGGADDAGRRPGRRGGAAGPRRDAGQPLDNACKWARRRASVRASDDGHGGIVIVVEDDGNGLPEDDVGGVLGRGVRADESTAGSGLGLAIVRDLADLYGGTLTLGRAARRPASRAAAAGGVKKASGSAGFRNSRG